MNFKDIMAFNAPYNQKNFDRLIEKIKLHEIVPYIGAGMSMLFNDVYPSWGGFLNVTFDEFVEPSQKKFFDELNYEDKADFLYKEMGKITFAQHLKEIFGQSYLEKDVSEFLDKSIYLLPIIFEKGLVITTNYDKVIEKSYLLHNLVLPVAHPGHFEALNGALRDNELLLYKIHGDISEPTDSIILTNAQYNSAYSNPKLIETLKQIYTSKSMLFLGCSIEKDRPIEFLCNVSKSGMYNYAIISCNNEEKKDKRLQLENNYFVQAIIYPDGKHECVKVILEQIAKIINPIVYKKIKDEYYDLTKQGQEYTRQQGVRELSENDVDNQENKNKAKVDDINFAYKVKICKDIKRLLIENHRIFINYGPRSESALENPLSNACEIWQERKCEKIIPNNETIVKIIEDNKDLFSIDEYEICYEFIEHANGYKKSCFSIMEDVKQFPKKFDEVISTYAKN